MSHWIAAHLWLIPAIPSRLVSRSPRPDEFAAGHCRRTRGRGTGGRAAVSRSALSARPSARPAERAFQNFTWFQFGEQTFRLGFVLDPLAGGDAGDDHASSASASSFSASVTWRRTSISSASSRISRFSRRRCSGVVIANSLLLLFICWELVGLASYLLIGFWIHKPSAAAAAEEGVHHHPDR